MNDYFLDLVSSLGGEFTYLDSNESTFHQWYVTQDIDNMPEALKREFREKISCLLAQSFSEVVNDFGNKQPVFDSKLTDILFDVLPQGSEATHKWFVSIYNAFMSQQKPSQVARTILRCAQWDDSFKDFVSTVECWAYGTTPLEESEDPHAFIDVALARIDGFVTLRGIVDDKNLTHKKLEAMTTAILSRIADGEMFSTDMSYAGAKAYLKNVFQNSRVPMHQRIHEMSSRIHAQITWNPEQAIKQMEEYALLTSAVRAIMKHRAKHLTSHYIRNASYRQHIDHSYRDCATAADHLSKLFNETGHY